LKERRDDAPVPDAIPTIVPLAIVLALLVWALKREAQGPDAGSPHP
jgi:hypothetical protein